MHVCICMCAFACVCEREREIERETEREIERERKRDRLKSGLGTVTCDVLFPVYRVLPRIPVTKESEPLLEIDRNARKLEAFLSGQSGNLPRLNVADLRKFLPCTINLDPYLRKLIRGQSYGRMPLIQE